ncbi:MAG: sugar lactone lactonase YvrE [Limimaricola cinnabarinus]|jgi:sugar lactone lactonase YvrE
MLAAGPVSAQGQDPASGQPQLEEVATFDHQVTGVTVTEDGRIFVNFPRWTEDAPISVAEVVDGEVRPYPNEEWNSWRNARKNEISPEDHWVCVQSVVADGQGNLWVLDPAAPASSFIVPNGPKLVRIDLATDEVAQTIAFDTDVAPLGSYLNDVRFSPDGSYAYITDSGPADALIVVDLQSGEARRLLDDHPSVKADPEVLVEHEGEPIRRPDNRAVVFAADSIALSNDGETLYWKPLTGETLYSIPTAALENPELSADALAAEVIDEGEVGVTDGLWIDEEDRLYLSAVEEDAVKVREDQEITTLIEDDRLRWPDTFSQGPDGMIYVTTSRIMDMSWYKPQNPIQLPTALWMFDPDGNTGQVEPDSPSNQQ